MAVATTTTATVTTKRTAKAKPFEFDFDATSFNNDETKAADGIDAAKAKAKLFKFNFDAASVKNDETKADGIDDVKAKAKSLEFDFDAASIKNDETRAADGIDDAQFDVDAASVTNDETRAAAGIDDAQFYVDAASITNVETRAADGIDDAQFYVDAVSIQNNETETADDWETADDGEIKVEENSFEQVAADVILMMSDDTDVLTVSFCGLDDRDIVDLVPSSTEICCGLSSNENQMVDVMFVYPFVGGQAIENAAKGLFLFHYCYCMPTVLLQLQEQACQAKKSFVTVMKQDQEWLCDGGWLNDNFISFWLQWVTRMESHPDSIIHTMITYFYTKLEHEGVESVLHWMTKNNIDILLKKFVFVPIHKNLHWSLMVIVNACLVDHFDESNAAFEVPCMLHLDGLSLHGGKEIADNLRLWLNSEWKKNKTSSVNVFTTLTMDSFSLTGERHLEIKFGNYSSTIMTTSNLFFLHLVPKQTNSFDCGVYLCQFALSMYSHHFHLFTYESMYHVTPVLNNIIQSPSFQLSSTDITILRGEMGELLDKLSIIYNSKNSEIMNFEVEAPSAEMVSPEIYKTNSPFQDTILPNKTSTAEMC